MSTYSLFILKPGFINRYEELQNILKDNDIVIKKEKKLVLPLKKIENHYAEHKGKNFYNGLVDYMTKGDVKGICKFDPTVIVMEVASNRIESEESFIARTRALVKNVIRPKFVLEKEDFKNLTTEDFEELTKTANVLHASDSPESASREIENLF